MRMRLTPSFFVVGGIAALAGLAYPAVWAAEAADTQSRKVAAQMTGGDPDRGKVAIEAYGCASCHTIPGIHGADANVGPSLAKVGTRSYLGGVLDNTPEHLVSWLLNPRAIDSKTAMPNLHLKEQEAKDVACYLYTLR